MARRVYRGPEGRQAIESWCREALDGWSRDHRSRTLRTTLGPTHVLTAGEGPDVVWLSGTNFCGATSLAVLDRLARDHRVHAVDVPGQPGLTSARRPSHPSELGDWLVEVVAALDLHEPTIVGHSLGGLVALAGAARGLLAGRLVLLAPAGLVRLQVHPRILTRSSRWLARPTSAAAHDLLELMTEGTVDAGHVEWMALVGQHVRTSLAPPPLPDAALRRVSVPTLVLAGSEDIFLPPGRLRPGLRRLSDATLEVVDGTGHLLPEERPDTVALAIGRATER